MILPVWPKGLVRMLNRSSISPTNHFIASRVIWFYPNLIDSIQRQSMIVQICQNSKTCQKCHGRQDFCRQIYVPQHILELPANWYLAIILGDAKMMWKSSFEDGLCILIIIDGVFNNTSTYLFALKGWIASPNDGHSRIYNVKVII